MHYIWQYRLWNFTNMSTVDGRSVRIIDPGTLNTDAGPDFFNAKIEATPAQATAKSEEENAAFDVFFNKLKHIFK